MFRTCRCLRAKIGRSSGSSCAETYSESIAIVSASKCTLRSFSPFAFVTLTTLFYGSMSRGVMVSNSLTRTPVRRREHLVDLLFLEVVGDVLQDCRKGDLSAITVVILNVVFLRAAGRRNQSTNRQMINRMRLKNWSRSQRREDPRQFATPLPTKEICCSWCCSSNDARSGISVSFYFAATLCACDSSQHAANT
jgi:hypothetical protein